ncbi:MAG: Mur ligase family protein, partial [bacterium]|nr:Mur ligase family protein [bacterium]
MITIKFSELLKLLLVVENYGQAEVLGVTSNCALVEPGYVFVAICGARFDGHSFIDEAIQRGAVALVVSKPMDLSLNVAWIQVPDTRVALPIVADAVHGSPSRMLRMIGITGTNGKTTVAYLVKSILTEAKQRAALIGTIQIEIGDEIQISKNTTPESYEIQELLGKMVVEKNTHCVMEVSSHALALHRVDKIEFDTVVFTNLSQDHLDMHNTMEEYFAVKATLFTSLGKDSAKANKTMVINIDDPWGLELASKFNRGVLTVGI